MEKPAEGLVGEVLGGVYRVEGVIGAGGMGTVYTARSQRTFGLFAIKVLNQGLAADAQAYAHFRQEARIASSLRHPNIVQVIDLDELDDGRPYLVMEYLEGRDLEDRLRREGPLAPDQVLAICRQVAAALHAVHRLGAVHRDLTPSNIFLLPTGGGSDEHVKVIDFGLSRVRGGLDSPLRTSEVQVLGTPVYMSPEGARGRHEEVDGRSDQFSLAVIAYQMLSAHLPFGASSTIGTLSKIIHEAPPPLASLVPDLPGGLVAAIHRAMSKRKEDRFDTVLDFVRALEAGSRLPGQKSLGSSSLTQGEPEDEERRILLVEDDDDLAVLLMDVLRSCRYTCRLVRDGDRVMAAVRDFAPHLVILDVILPGKNGYRLCWEIKSVPAYRDVPVVLTSSKSQAADHQMGSAVRADAYLDKPFEMTEILAVVAEQLTRRSARSIPSPSYSG